MKKASMLAAAVAAAIAALAAIVPMGCGWNAQYFVDCECKISCANNMDDCFLDCTGDPYYPASSVCSCVARCDGEGLCYHGGCQRKVSKEEYDQYQKDHGSSDAETGEEDPAGSTTRAGADGVPDVLCPEDISIPAKGCGVFVSSSLGDDDSGRGDIASPVRTLRRAVELAVTYKPRIYACAEDFYEAVTVPPGVSIIGGLDCHHGWGVTSPVKQTMIAPGPGEIPLRIEPGSSGDVDAEFYHLIARALDGAESSRPSIAALVKEGAHARFTGCAFITETGATILDEEGAPVLDGEAVSPPAWP